MRPLTVVIYTEALGALKDPEAIVYITTVSGRIVTYLQVPS